MQNLYDIVFIVFGLKDYSAYGEPVSKEKEFNWDQSWDDSDVGMSSDFKAAIDSQRSFFFLKLIIHRNIWNLSREIEWNGNSRAEKNSQN